jgi:hypothetical protein
MDMMDGLVTLRGSHGIGNYEWMGIWDGAINIARSMVFGIWDSWILVFSKLYEHK